MAGGGWFPLAGALKLYNMYWKRTNFLSFALVAALCAASYFTGIWSNSGGAAAVTQSSSSSISCISSSSSSIVPSSSSKPAGAGAGAALDFNAHHAADDSPELDQPVTQYPACSMEYSEYTPCEDRRRSKKFDRDRLVFRERHCPSSPAELLRCLIPAPPGYRTPFRWPASRDVAWFANVPHKELTVEKAVQNWIRVDGDKFRFPGGGTMFPRGAGAYIDDIDELVSLRDGEIRTAIDTGCGVASWGAYLLSRDVIAMSIAPRDSHEAQVQFALERGVPAMIGILASVRLPYPSRAFDMAHCSRCLIPWHKYEGQFLIEIDRILRPGGYWVLSGPPINWKTHWKGWQRSEEDLSGEQEAIEGVARKLCWKKIKEKGDLAIWQKPINHIDCIADRKVLASPPMCAAGDPDAAWYTKLETCITPLPGVPSSKEVAGGELKRWPERLWAVPPRIAGGSIDGVTAEMFLRDTEVWKKRVAHYKAVNTQLGKNGRYRNLLDMNARLGGFAAAMMEDPLWVMNIVPTAAKPNTLGAIYERGLIGTYHDWCEAMSTYPRTYDLLHADSVFSLYKDRCEMEDILLEMDRILRPEGAAIFSDNFDVLVKIKSVTEGMRWESQIVDHEDGPLKREKLLFAVKTYWTPKSYN